MDTERELKGVFISLLYIKYNSSGDYRDARALIGRRLRHI